MLVYTAIFGPYDTLHEPAPDFPSNIDLVCFTDQPLQSDRWDVRRLPSWTDPVAGAKYHKMHPHKIFPDRAYTLWIDGNMTPRAACAKLPELSLDADLIVYEHPHCPGWHIEGLRCVSRGKCDPEAMHRQMEHYASEDLSPVGGLYNGGFLFRWRNGATRRFNECWWEQCSKYTMRDQVSMPYAIRATQPHLIVGTLPGNIYESEYVQVWGHGG